MGIRATASTWPAHACGFRPIGQEYAPCLASTATARHSPSKRTSQHSRSVHATPPPPPPAPGRYLGPSPQPWPPAGFLRRAERGRLRPQAEKALRNAAKAGDLATLTRLVEEGVDLEATDNGDDEDQVSATSPASNRIPLWPSLPAASASPALTACVPPSPSRP